MRPYASSEIFTPARNSVTNSFTSHSPLSVTFEDMRLPAPLLALLALAFSAVALAWTKDDYEIFDLVAALRKDVGGL